MPNTASNVVTGKPKIGGAIFRGDTTLTAPTDATADLASGFVSLGYISSDGVTNSNSASSTQFKDWGGNVVLESETEKPDTFKFKLIESLNSDVLKTVYGDSNVTTANNKTVVKATNAEQPYKSWVIDMVQGGKKVRVYIPAGKITTVGDISYKSDDIVAFEVTISARPDADGKTHVQFID